MKIHKSKIDNSVNIEIDGFEARFVQRDPSYFIIYVSSQKGCNQSCRMCHLTHTGQTDMTQATEKDFLNQVNEVMDVVLDNWMKKKIDLSKITHVHVNFMARGEPMLNPTVTCKWSELEHTLSNAVCNALDKLLTVHYLISTIFPYDVTVADAWKNKLIFQGFAESGNPPRIYYSAYPGEPDIRKKWLPNARSLLNGVTNWARYIWTLENNGHDVVNKLHFPVIKNVTDNLDYHKQFINVLDSLGLPGRHVNLIRYNPIREDHSEEASEQTYEAVAQLYRDHGHHVKIIPRVGTDVKASCGTFINMKEAL